MRIHESCFCWFQYLLLTFVGVLGAPFPYILGLHASFLDNKDCVFSSDSARVYLDKNLIEFGVDFSQLPELPERRAKKLLNVIIEHASAFEQRSENWHLNRLPYFDHAFSSVAALPPRDPSGNLLINESKIREGFLKFFVAILMHYRKCDIFTLILKNLTFSCCRFLVYNAPTNQPLKQFRSDEFLEGLH